MFRVFRAIGRRRITPVIGFLLSMPLLAACETDGTAGPSSAVTVEGRAPLLDPGPAPELTGARAAGSALTPQWLSRTPGFGAGSILIAARATAIELDASGDETRRETSEIALGANLLPTDQIMIAASCNGAVGGVLLLSPDSGAPHRMTVRCPDAPVGQQVMRQQIEMIGRQSLSGDTLSLVYEQREVFRLAGADGPAQNAFARRIYRATIRRDGTRCRVTDFRAVTYHLHYTVEGGIWRETLTTPDPGSEATCIFTPQAA